MFILRSCSVSYMLIFLISTSNSPRSPLFTSVTGLWVLRSAPPSASTFIHCVLTSSRSFRTLLAWLKASTVSASEVWTGFTTILATRTWSIIVWNFLPTQFKLSLSTLSIFFILWNLSSADFGRVTVLEVCGPLIYLELLDNKSFSSRVHLFCL